jgi:Putative peptidoglycan binding domain
MATTLSPEQRAWLKDLGSIVGKAPVEDSKEKPEAGAEKGSQSSEKKSLVGAPGGDDKAALVGFTPLDIPGIVIEKIAGPVSAACMINNNTELVLKLDGGGDEIDDDSGKTMGLAHGEYKEFPPGAIKGGDQSAKFSAVNKTSLDLPILGKVHFKGVEGFVRYVIDEQKTAWVLHFSNPLHGSLAADARVEGANAAQYEAPSPMKGGGNDAKFLFVLNRKGAAPPSTPPVVPPPGKEPNKDPAAAANVPSSCMITVVNDTAVPLKRAEAKHERGDFMVPPPNTIPPGGSVTFASVETPNAKEQGCKGFIVWEVGSPMSAAWRIEWDNPEQAKNTSSATLTPQSAGFGSQDVIGQGEDNVPVSFTLSGGGGGGGKEPKPEPKEPKVPKEPVDPVDPDDPDDPVDPEEDVPYEPPAEAKQPTLRKGDKTKDGWVEYAQLLLNFHLKTKLKEDGDFGNATLSAVLKFQKDKKLQVDGTIGNQTWAALREGAPEKPSTDGRKPHEFVEEGAEARWVTKDAQFNLYFADRDEYWLVVESVGDTPLDPSSQATVRITPPGGKAKTVKVAVGEGEKNAKGDGAMHFLVIDRFLEKFPLPKDTEDNKNGKDLKGTKEPKGSKVNAYQAEGYLPEELGGDRFAGKVKSS